MISDQFLLNANNPVIGNHKVYGRELLPGLAYLDLIFQLFRAHHYSYAELELRNLTIYNPLTVGQDQDVMLGIRCSEMNDGQWRIVLEGQERHNGALALDKKRYAAAEMHQKKPVVFKETLDMRKIKQSAGRIVSLDEVYQQCRRQDLEHTGFMKAEGAIYDTGASVVIDISIGRDALPGAAGLMFHPALIDGSGVGSGLLLSSLVKEEQRLFLPLFYESFQASALLQKKCVTRIQTASMGRKKELLYLTMEFFNESGRKIAELRNLTNKLVRAAELINPDGRNTILPASGNRRPKPILSPPEKSIKEHKVAGAVPSAGAEFFLRQLLAGRLKKTVEQIETHVGYYEMGLDSPGLLEVVQDIEAKIEAPLPPTLLFEYTTIAELSDYLTRYYPSRFGCSSPLEPDAGQEQKRSGIPGAVSMVAHAAAAPAAEEEIAIIGMAGRFPQAKNLRQFWRNLQEGKDCVSEIPASRWDWRCYAGLKSPAGKDMSKWGGFIDDPDCFDPLFFRISPREAEVMDPQERLFLETCWEALEDAGYTPKTLVLPRGANKRRQVGVFVGVMHKDYALIGAETLSRGAGVFPLSLNYAPIANRVSYFCNFHGPSLAIDTVCSSSLAAVHLAMESIRRGECEAALAGGVNLCLHPNKYISYGLMDLHSSDGHCHTFGRGGDGYVSGEGIGAVLLKPLSQAVKDRDHVYAVIKGSTVNHVGTVSGITVPSPVAQAELIVACLEKTGINARTISYVEAHGTGTSLGDPIEIEGLVKAYRHYTQDLQFCSIGSVKSNIGHAESAAGISGLIKAALQLYYKTLVPSLNSEELNPYINFKQSPFFVQHKTEAWKQPSVMENGRAVGYPRRAGVSSFGATGLNAHIVLEEYPPRETRQQAPSITGAKARSAVIPISAKNEERLQAYAGRLLDFLQELSPDKIDQQREKERQAGLQKIPETEEQATNAYRGEISLADLAYTLQVGREAMEERAVFLVQDIAELAAKLAAFVQGEKAIDNCWRGQVKHSKETVGFLNADEDFWETVHDKWMDKGKVAIIAELWAKGLAVDWEMLYGDAKPRRISLPTYPFARERYWVPQTGPKDDNATISPARAAWIHPMLQQNTSDIYGLRFSTTFTGREFFLSEHAVHGRRVLPGAVCLEMARAAVEQAASATWGEGRTGIRLTNVIWDRPVAVGEQALRVHVELLPGDNGEIAYAIYSEPGEEADDDEPVALSQGSAVLNRAAAVPGLDLPGLKARCDQGGFSSIQCYEAFKMHGVDYGPGYRGVEEVYAGPGQLLAKLSLPSSVSATEEQFVLHPSLLESVWQASAVLISGSGDSAPSTLKPVRPLALQELEIFSNCGSAMWALVKVAESSQAGAETPKLDIDLCDEQGTVCVRMKGLSAGAPEVALQASGMSKTVPFASSAEHRPVEPPVGTFMLFPVWEAVPAEQGPNFPSLTDRVVIVGGNEYGGSAVQQLYPQASVLEIQPRNSIDQITKKLEAHGLVDHIVWVAPYNTLEPLADDVLIEEQNRGVLQVFRIVKALLRLGYGDNDLGWTVLTVGAQSVNKEDVMHRAAHAGIHGLAGSLAKEYPNWRIRLIDLEAHGDWPVAQIFALPVDRRGRAWAYRNKEWYRQQLIPFHCPPPEQTLYRTGGVYVVIGGAGGIGEAWSQYMIRACKAQIIWIGRRKKDAVIQTKLDRLAILGPAPHYISADAADRNALQQACAEIKKRYGQIHGVVHSAMVFTNQSLEEMREEQFKAGLSAKVDVSVRLAQVFQKEPLDFVLFFSSMIAFIKNPQQSHYASGCAFKDAFARRLAREWPCAVKVMNWGYWGSAETMADEDMQQLARIGLGLIEPEDGMQTLEMLLARPVEQVALMKTTRPLAVEGMNYKELITVYPKNISLKMENIRKHIVAQDAPIKKIELEMSRLIDMDQIVCRLLWGQLRSMGLFAGKELAVTDMRTQSGVRDIYVPWLEESIAVLARKNYLQCHGELCAVIDAAPTDTDAVWQEWERQKNAWFEDANIKAWAVLVEATLRALPDILTGKALATDIIFPNSSMELVEGIYKHNLIADYFNEVLAGTVAAYVQERLNLDASARMRLLEIGAGTGGTSAMVLQKLKPYREHMQEYCYTDISKAFLMHAEKEYGSENPYLTYKIFNVEEPAAGQDISAGGYDIVIAANVLHATKDIRQTLRNAKAVLQNNGLLILNEMSTGSLFAHVTFGLLEGWWRYEDKALRIPGCPGLYPETWQELLAGEGFRPVFFPTQKAHYLGQQIVVAASDGIVRQKQEVGPGAAIVKQEAQKTAPIRPSIQPNAAIKKAKGIANELLREKSNSYIKRLVGEVLKLPSHKIDSAEPLEKYGIDSILIVQLANVLGQELDGISSTLFFEYQTIDALVEHLIETQKDALVKVAGLENKELEADTTGGDEIADLPPISRPGPAFRKSGRFGQLRGPEIKEPDHGPAGEPVAIIGISGRFPQAKTLQEYWENLKAGRDCITEIPQERWPLEGFYHSDPQEAVAQGKSYSKWGGFMEGFADFDPLFFNISPREAINIDPQERLFTASCWEVLEDAGYTREQLAARYNGRVGVFAGITKTGFDLYGPDLWKQGAKIFPHTLFGSVANRVSYLLNLHGPSMPIDTMCSSSLTAIHEACAYLRRGECEMAIAGGVNLYLHPACYIGLCAKQMLSRNNRCAAFGQGGNGFVPGEGVGCVLLKPLSRAEQDGDRIYALILGSHTNHGGKTNGYMVPNPNAQRDLILENFRKSGVDPRTISYVEAAALGSDLGDPIEFTALTKAFARHTSDKYFCAIGSVKPNIGHLEAASGISQLAKVILQLRHQQLLPSINAEPLNPEISFDNTPFYLQRELLEWKRPLLEINGKKQEFPRRATISSFGAGGVNTHLIVEEYIPAQEEIVRSHSTASPQIVVLSAKNQERLRAVVQQMLGFLKYKKELWLPDLAYTLQMGREAMASRLAMVVGHKEELAKGLDEYLEYGQQNKDLETSIPIFTGDLEDEHREIRDLLSGKIGETVIQALLAEKNLEKLALYWVKGGQIPWETLQAGQKARKISLPTYPFEKRRCWFDFPEPALFAGSDSLLDGQIGAAHTADSPVKDLIVDIMSGLLGMASAEVNLNKPVGEYGFDSILLLQLLQQIQTTVDPSIDLAGLRECKTIQDIINTCRPPKGEQQRLLGQQTRINIPAAWPQFPELIHLNNSLQGRPVFWFHGGMGGVEAYQAIAQNIGRPFYGIQARGWMTSRSPLRGIQAMASYYVHIIQSLQPEGPYDLGGYSLGGFLAYEVTRQLQELGQTVDTIVMVDALDGAGGQADGQVSAKSEILKAVNTALAHTIRQEPEKMAGTLIHRDEVNLNAEDDELLKQLIMLAKKRGLTKTKAQLFTQMQQNVKVQQAYYEERFLVLPLPAPQTVTCYYFRNKSGLLLGELEPYLVADNQNLLEHLDHANYWGEWQRQLPNLHMLDVDSSNHMMMLSEPKSYAVIAAFCEKLYSAEGMTAKFFKALAKKTGQAQVGAANRKAAKATVKRK